MPETPKKKFRIRFGFKTLAALTVLFAGIAWWYAIGYAMWLDYRDRVAFQSISEYELGQAITTRQANEVISGLVTIIGDSRLKHWNVVDGGQGLSDGRFVSEGRDGTIRFWDLETGQTVGTVFADQVFASGDGHRYFTRKGDHIEGFNSEGDKLVVQTELPEIPKKNDYEWWATNQTGSLIAFVRNNEIQIYDVNKKTWSIEKPTGVNNLFCAHCHPLMNASGDVLLIPQSSRVYLHDRKKISETESKIETVAMKSSISDSSPVTVMKFSDDQQDVFLGDMSGNLGKLNLPTREVLEYETGDFYAIHGLSLQSDGIVYDQAAEIILLKLKDGTNVSKERILGGYHNMRFLKNDLSGRLVGGRENRLHVWDRTREITPGIESTWTPTCIEFSSDGWSLAVGCADGRVRIFRVGSWALVREIDFGPDPIKSLAYSSTGQLAVRDLTRVVVFQSEKGNEVFESKAKGVFFHHAMAFSKDGSMFAFGLSNGGQGAIEVVDLNRKAKNKTLVIPQVEQRQPGFFRLKPRQTAKLNFRGSLFFAGTEDHIFAATAFQNVTVWDSRSETFLGHIGKPEFVLGWPYAKAVISPDGKLIAMQSASKGFGVWNGFEDGLLTESNEPVHYVEEQSVYEFDFCFSHSGKELASVTNDGFLRIRDTSTFEVLHAIQLSGPGSQIPGIKYSRDDRYIATLNGNGTVYIIRNPAR